MKKYLLDTNTLISFMTDRNPVQQEKISPYFARASRGEISLTIHLNVVIEFVYVMQKVYHLPGNRIRNILQLLANAKGIEVVSRLDFTPVLSLWHQHISDFGDAVLAAFARESGDMEILTFDRDFREELEKLKISCPAL